MKKINSLVITALALILASTSLNAQVGLKIGYAGNATGIDGGGFYNGFKIGVDYEYMFTDKLSASAGIEYTHSKSREKYANEDGASVLNPPYYTSFDICNLIFSKTYGSIAIPLQLRYNILSFANDFFTLYAFGGVDFRLNLVHQSKLHFSGVFKYTNPDKDKRETVATNGDKFCNDMAQNNRVRTEKGMLKPLNDALAALYYLQYEPVVKRGDVALFAGAGLDINSVLSLYVSYERGLINQIRYKFQELPSLGSYQQVKGRSFNNFINIGVRFDISNTFNVLMTNR